jgi:hypothetical protein
MSAVTGATRFNRRNTQQRKMLNHEYKWSRNIKQVQQNDKTFRPTEFKE